MRRKATTLRVLHLIPILLATLTWNLAAQTSSGRIFTVNDVRDSVDASVGDGVCADTLGKCTLRAAIDEANATAARDAIIFDVPLPAVITLNIGELKTTNQVRIFGRGARQLTIERNNASNISHFRVFNFAAPTHLYAVTVRNGDTFGNGGGILASEFAVLTDVALTGNRANAGGGISIQGKESSAVLDRCLISSNIATGQGGGMYVIPSSGAVIKVSTFTGNSALQGGGIANYGAILAANNTISRNSATQAVSGFLNAAGGRADLVNNIIGPDASQSVNLVEGEFRSTGNNIVTNITGSTGWTGSDQTSTTNGLDPMLGPLANNGGQLDSIALLPGSPAIGTGNRCVISLGGGGCGVTAYFYDINYDQRRFGPLGTGIDVGAYEAGAAPATSSLTTQFGWGRSPQLVYSRVNIINTETLEIRRSFLTMQTDGGAVVARTSAIEFVEDGKVYLIELRTKRGGISPRVRVCTFGGDGCTDL